MKPATMAMKISRSESIVAGRFRSWFGFVRYGSAGAETATEKKKSVVRSELQALVLISHRSWMFPVRTHGVVGRKVQRSVSKNKRMAAKWLLQAAVNERVRWIANGCQKKCGDGKKLEIRAVAAHPRSFKARGGQFPIFPLISRGAVLPKARTSHAILHPLVSPLLCLLATRLSAPPAGVSLGGAGDSARIFVFISTARGRVDAPQDTFALPPPPHAICKRADRGPSQSRRGFTSCFNTTAVYGRPGWAATREMDARS